MFQIFMDQYGLVFTHGKFGKNIKNTSISEVNYTKQLQFK